MPRNKDLKPGSPVYKHEYQMQIKNGEPARQKERAKSRALYAKAGINVPEGMQIEHIKKVAQNGKSVMSNLRLRSTHANEADNLHKKGETKGKK
jgi:hypothetical protein